MMKRILTVADSIENTRYSVARCVNTYNDYSVDSMLAVPQFTGAEADEQVDIGEVLDYCFTEEQFDAIFVGMIRDSVAVETVSSKLMQYDHAAVVAELSIITPEGQILVSRDTYNSIVNSLMQNVHFLTINVYEAELLSGIECHGPADVRQAAEAICEKFHSVVFVEGGSKTGGRDLFVLGGKAKWYDGTADHTVSSKKNFTASVACELASGKTIDEAVVSARLYCGITTAVDEPDTTVEYIPANEEPAKAPVVEAEHRIVPDEPEDNTETKAAEELETTVVAPISSLVSPAKSIRDAARSIDTMPSRIKFGSGISIPSNGILARELAKSSNLTAVTSNIESHEAETAKEPDPSMDDVFARLRKLSEM